MGKFTNDSVMDAALDALVGNQLHVCSAQPTTRTEAVTTYNLASASISGGDYTKADGDTSGRKTTLGAKTGLSITASGTATHVAVTSAGALLEVTTCTSQALTSGGTVDTSSFKHEIGDPT